MSNWADTLAQFAEVIRTGADFAPGDIACPRYTEARGVEVYRNNYRGTLHDTLAGAYPVIRQLVGEDFFRLLAKRFIGQHASRSGNLHRYGSELAEFLLGFEQTRHLAYLPDMARLEWAYHHAYFADDVAPFEVARLATVAAGAYEQLRWQLHPSCALLVSDHPVAAIWQAHQEDAPADMHIDLCGGGDSMLVYRKGVSVEIYSIEAASHHWLAQLQQGNAMGVATDATLNFYPDFDLATTLRHWLAQGVLCDFDIAVME